jgi:hypothetical protein
MIQKIVTVDMAVHETMPIEKNRLMPEKCTGREKRLSIVTGIHGDELDGQYICYEIIRRINEHPECLKGIVDVYPCINPLGMDTGIRGIPMFDLDMNRVFPGTEDGSMAEYVAAKVVNDIIGSDLCLDIHSSNIFIKETPQIRLNEENADKLLAYAGMLNADFIWVYPSKTVLEATLSYSLNKLSVPTLAMEMGKGLRINNAYCLQITEGIFNLMKEMGIWTGEINGVIREPIISVEGEVTVMRSDVTGVFVSEIDGLGPIKKGQMIGKIISPVEGRVLQSFEAPSDGIIFTLREHPVVYKGVIIARVHGGRNA